MTDLRLLYQIVEGFYSETSLEHLSQRVVEVVGDLLNCSFAGIFRFDAEAGEAVQVAGYGEELPVKGLVGCLVQELPREGHIWIHGPGPFQAEGRELLESFPLSSLMLVPISRENEGDLLVAARRLGEPVFGERDLELLQMLGRPAGIALENCRLYEELRNSVRELEASRAAVNRAEKIAAAGRVTASIAHELNNPLQSISNCLHLAGRPELPQSERDRYLELAQSELDRLILTVRRTLDLYRPIVRDRRLVNVNDLISRVVRLMEPQLKAKMIEVHYQFDAGLPWVSLVGDQVQQVFINLILNSIDAMPAGGEISIKTGPTMSGQSPAIEIFVKDSGPGISEDEIEHIFEPFFSTKENGTGLGLPVSYSIVAAHGGSLNYIREKGKGACFRIVFPENGINEGENPGS
jgi:signal transduction histidine kinase